MKDDFNITQEIIFVDCFNTLIFRKSTDSEIIKAWDMELSQKFNIPAKKIYRSYKNINFRLCFSKFFREGALIESFETVIKKMIMKFQEKYPSLNSDEFKNFALEIYIKKESMVHFVKEDFIVFLRKQKEEGKKIFIVSDFYCTSSVISTWLESLGIDDLFTQVFSSCDYNKEKATGKLYRFLLGELKVNPNNIIMLGDNLWSDVFMARYNKLKAKCIKGKF
ncbi:MAG: HAD family hydrolase [Treponema sp.]|nr:HAD family hydrolase [Treponema sp.]